MIDFLVVGGGIAGLSAGARLSKLGTVTVLEAEPALGYHASGRSAALFESSYGLPSTVALNMASHEYHRDANGGYLSPRGLLAVATAQQSEDFEVDVVDLSLEPCSVEEACDKVPILNPDVVERAGYHDAAWDIDTDRMLQDFARDIRGAGGSVVTKARVTGIEKDQQVWRVATSDVTYEARQLVNAAGAWADQIATMAGVAPMGLTPKRRSMARLPAPGGHDTRAWPMLMGAGETWYAKPDAGKWLVSPAEEDPVAPQDAYADDMVLAEGLARYEQMVTEPVTRVETNWAGLRTFAPDKSLVLGPDPDTPNFVWCAGQGGYGFQTAPAASQLLSHLLSGTPPVLPKEAVDGLTPDRLR